MGFSEGLNQRFFIALNTSRISFHFGYPVLIPEHTAADTLNFNNISLIAGLYFAQPGEHPDNGNIDFDGNRTVYTGKHGHARTGECIWQLTQPHADVIDVAICDFQIAVRVRC